MRSADITIAELAGRQHGVVARWQLLAAGVSPDVVDRRAKQQRIHRVHRGVYRVGPVVAPNAREMAAVLAAGPSAVLSHRSAAELWQLLPRRGAAGFVDVTDPSGNHRRPGIRIRQTCGLAADEVTNLAGIPITTPSRTLFDLASVTPSRPLEQAMAEAFARRLADPAGLRKLLGRQAGARGVRALRALLDGDDPALTRSEAEERFLSLVRRARLGAPGVNVRMEGYEVDFLWSAERLVVEIDGRAYHGSARAFERDRRRDADLTAAGLRVIRVTWRQIEDEPVAVVAQVARALARGPSGATHPAAARPFAAAGSAASAHRSAETRPVARSAKRARRGGTGGAGTPRDAAGACPRGVAGP